MKWWSELSLSHMLFKRTSDNFFCWLKFILIYMLLVLKLISRGDKTYIRQGELFLYINAHDRGIICLEILFTESESV